MAFTTVFYMLSKSLFIYLKTADNVNILTSVKKPLTKLKMRP